MRFRLHPDGVRLATTRTLVGAESSEGDWRFSSNVATLVLDNAGGRLTITGPHDPYRWVGGTVSDIALESRHHPVGLLFV